MFVTVIYAAMLVNVSVYATDANKTTMKHFDCFARVR